MALAQRKPHAEPAVVLGAAPGKVILFGEHAVVYGQPALGVALGRGVRVSVRKGSGKVEAKLAEGVRSPELAASATPEKLVKAALGARAEELDVEIEIEVPPLAGLGTSAALAIAVLRAKDALDDVTEPAEVMLDRAMEVENLAHGASSGLDPAICLYGGVVEFQRRETKGKNKLQVRRVTPALSFHLVIGVHGTHGGTKDRIRGVAMVREQMPQAFDASIKALGQISRAGSKALIKGDLEVAGRALDLAHGVLSGLGLVGDAIEHHVRNARRAGALGAKMSGAGGSGGAFFALAPDFQAAQRVKEAIEAAGAMSWVETAAE